MNKSILAITAVILLLVFALIIKADGFGEYSGYLIYDIPINSSHTEAWTLINSYNYTLSFYIQPPNLTIGSSNVTPTLKFSELNGTIAPDSNYQINVTVFIPVGAATNTTWQGYATAFASGHNQSNSSAKIQIGTAKLIQITSEPQVVIKKKTTISTTTNTTAPTTLIETSAPSSGNGVSDTTLIIAVLGAALVGAIAYILGSRNRNNNNKNTGNNKR
jgi:hypothetical protein